MGYVASQPVSGEKESLPPVPGAALAREGPRFSLVHQQRFGHVLDAQLPAVSCKGLSAFLGACDIIYCDANGNEVHFLPLSHPMG